MWKLVALAALLAIPGSLSAQTADVTSVPAVTIRVYRSSVPAVELRAARRLTDQILGASGISLRWLTCGPESEDPAPIPVACSRPLGANELILHIVPTVHRRSSDNEQALGIAAVDVVARAGTVATIYSEHVAAVARAALTSRVDLLGRAMAHEIGHLLMGTNRHAARGLMRAVFSRDELRRDAPRDWVFSELEATAMRHAIALRGVPLPASHAEPEQGR